MSVSWLWSSLRLHRQDETLPWPTRHSLALILLVSSLAYGDITEKRDTIAINIPATPPNTASAIIDHGYMGLGFSPHTFQHYSGNLSSPNIFSRNLVQTIADRTGSPVHIRAGGTSGDYAVYDPDQTVAVKYPPGYTLGAPRNPRGMRLGPSWYEGFENFPGAQWTYTAHLVNNSAGMMENSVAGVQQMLKHVGANLESVEIGNEVNFYAPEGMRPADYGAADFVREWNTYSSAIQKGALQGTRYSNVPIWRAMGYYDNYCPWCISNTFEKGLTASTNIKSAALHAYMVLGQKSLNRQRDFMNHTVVVNKLDPFKEPIAYLNSKMPGMPFHLSEVNSATYCVESTRPYIGVFGSALWLADWLLYGATINIARMNVQQSTTFAYSSWRPVPFNGQPPAVLPPYYAHPFVADVIGNSGDIKIANIDVNSDTFSAYAIYGASSRKVIRIVLINLLDWSSKSETSRPSSNVSLTVGNRFAGSVTVDRLTASGSDILDASKITWKGTSWTYASNGMPVRGLSDSMTVEAAKGKFTVSVKASEAVLLTLH